MQTDKPIPLPPSPRRRRSRPRGYQKGAFPSPQKLAALATRRDIRLFFLGLTRDNLSSREHIKYLVDTKKIFEERYAWLLKIMLQYAFGVPAPLEEELADVQHSLVFLSANPIGQDAHDPLLRAKPVDPAQPAHELPATKPDVTRA